MEIDALFDGYIRRRERLEDLFIVNCRMPVEKGQLKHPPSFKKLTAHRKKTVKAGEISEDVQNFWRKILKGGIRHAQEHGAQTGN